MLGAEMRDRDRRELFAPPALALVVCGLFLVSALYLLDGRPGLPLDDSWIHLAFARNLAAGHGLALHPDAAAVAGTTAPLWTALTVFAVLLPGGDVPWMLLFGLLCHLAGIVVTWLLARELGLGRGLAVLAAGLAAATGWLAWSALSGMEIPLFILLSVGGMVLHLRERGRPEGRDGPDAPARSDRPPLSLAVLGLSVLARPEGLLLLGLAAGDRLLRFRRSAPDRNPADRPGGLVFWSRPGSPEWRKLAGGLGAATLAVAPVALYFLAIGGSPLPTTLGAKTGVGGAHLPELRDLHVAAGVFFRAQPWLTVLAPAGALSLVRRLGTPRDRGLLPALWLAGLPLAYSCLGRTGDALIGNFGRYLFPLLPVLIVLGVLGLEPIVRAVGPGGILRGARSPARSALALAGLLLLIAPTAVDCARTATLYARNVADVEAGDVRMARWLAERLPPEAVVATMDIGAMAAILPNRIVDLAGIGDPELHDFIRKARARGGTWQDGVLALIGERRPDYLMIFPDWLGPVDRPGSPFRRLHTIHVPDNVTLGRDTLALYATPWTRYGLGQAPEELRP
jgi:hypothetical protein